MAMALAMRQVEHVLVVALRCVFLLFEPHVGPTAQCDAIPWKYALAVSGCRSPFQINASLCVGVRRVLVGVVLSLLTFVLPFVFSFGFAFSISTFGVSLNSLANLPNFLCLFTS